MNKRWIKTILWIMSILCILAVIGLLTEGPAGFWDDSYFEADIDFRITGSSRLAIINQDGSDFKILGYSGKRMYPNDDASQYARYVQSHSPTINPMIGILQIADEGGVITQCNEIHGAGNLFWLDDYHIVQFGYIDTYQAGLFVTNITECKIEQILYTSQSEPSGSGFSYSSDRWIAIDELDREVGVLVINPDLETVFSIPNAMQPAWSSDGHQLAVVINKNDEYTISIYDRHGAILFADIADGLRPSWAPDGKHIVFESLEKEITILDIETEEETVIYSGGIEPYWHGN